MKNWIQIGAERARSRLNDEVASVNSFIRELNLKTGKDIAPIRTFGRGDINANSTTKTLNQLESLELSLKNKPPTDENSKTAILDLNRAVRSIDKADYVLDCEFAFTRKTNRLQRQTEDAIRRHYKVYLKDVSGGTAREANEHMQDVSRYLKDAKERLQK